MTKQRAAATAELPWFARYTGNRTPIRAMWYAVEELFGDYTRFRAADAACCKRLLVAFCSYPTHPARSNV